MSRVFFTSDLHFGHERLCLGLRGMTSKESDELIINNWNKVINKRDIVYILGDVTMENPKAISSYMNRLNGTKIVVGGNHDDKRCCAELAKIGIVVMGVCVYKGFLLTHIPVVEQEMVHFRGNIHGHIHKQSGTYNPESPSGRYYNVNTEFHNYTPILFEEIEKSFMLLNNENDNNLNFEEL